jgi:hypothetical protein
MKSWHKGAAHKQALKTLLIPIFVSTEQAMVWGSRLNAKQHATLVKTQSDLSDAARDECNPQRKLNLATQSQLMREAVQAVGMLGARIDEAPRLDSANGRLRSVPDVR